MIKAAERRATWQRLGNDVTGLSVKEAMAKAGIDFTVGMVPLVAAIPSPTGYTTPDGETINEARRVVGYNVTYRNDTGQPIGPVGSRYHVVQTKDATDLIEAMTAGGWQPEFAGLVNKGRAVFMAGRMNMADLSTEVDPYLCFVNSFDGSSGLKFACTPVRPRCTNQIKAIFSTRQTVRPVVSLRHTSNVMGRAEMVRDLLGLSQTYYRYLDEQIDRLLNIPLTERRLDEVLNLVAPLVDDSGKDLVGYKHDKRLDKRSEITSTLANSETIPDDMRYTAWGIYNAMTEIEQWGKSEMPSLAQADQALGRHLGMVPMVTTSDRVLKTINSWLVQA